MARGDPAPNPFQVRIPFPRLRLGPRDGQLVNYFRERAFVVAHIAYNKRLCKLRTSARCRQCTPSQGKMQNYSKPHPHIAEMTRIGNYETKMGFHIHLPSFRFHGMLIDHTFLSHLTARLAHFLTFELLFQRNLNRVVQGLSIKEKMRYF
jgi:hypothetical protein